MEDFRIIYRILKYLCDSMDFEEFNAEDFKAETFKTNDNRFNALLIQMQKSGYIEGLIIRRYSRDSLKPIQPLNPRITLKGLEYLNENSMMKKAADIAKGITEIII